MNRRQIRKAAYKGIYKENRSHQEVFDEILPQDPKKAEAIAREVSFTPSSGRLRDTISLRYTYVGALVAIIILRTLGIFTMDIGDINMGLVVVLALVNVLVPAYGIYGALAGRYESYQLVAILLSLSLFRSFSRGDIAAGLDLLIVIVPHILAIGVAVFLMFKLRTNYTAEEHVQMVEGEAVNTKRYQFEDTRLHNSEILDADL